MFKIENLIALYDIEISFFNFCLSIGLILYLDSLTKLNNSILLKVLFGLSLFGIVYTTINFLIVYNNYLDKIITHLYLFIDSYNYALVGFNNCLIQIHNNLKYLMNYIYIGMVLFTIIALICELFLDLIRSIVRIIFDEITLEKISWPKEKSIKKETNLPVGFIYKAYS